MFNVMLDLETWGKSPGCAIRSIGAVEFDPISGEVGAEFYANVDDESCKVVGLVKDPDTVKWWDDQPQQARDALKEKKQDIVTISHNFTAWFRGVRGMFVWSQGANFDEPIMSAVFRATGMKTPWRFYNARDTRTVYDVARFDPRSVRRTGTHHNALDDARHQVRLVQLAYAKLYNGRAA